VPTDPLRGQLAQRFIEATRRKDYLAAIQAAEAALKIQPKHLGVMADHAFALMRQGRYAQAHAVYLRVYEATGGQARPGETWLDGWPRSAAGWSARTTCVATARRR
jgi:Flp pilus assembly protein TadD